MKGGINIEPFRVWVPKELKLRFLNAAMYNEVKCDELITKWISNYAEEHEENKAAEKLHQIADKYKKGDRSN